MHAWGIVKQLRNLFYAFLLATKWCLSGDRRATALLIRQLGRIKDIVTVAQIVSWEAHISRFYLHRRMFFDLHKILWTFHQCSLCAFDIALSHFVDLKSECTKLVDLMHFFFCLNLWLLLAVLDEMRLITLLSSTIIHEKTVFIDLYLSWAFKALWMLNFEFFVRWSRG